MPQSEIKMKMSLDGSGVKKTLNRAKASVQNFSKSSIAAIARFGAAFAGIGLARAKAGVANFVNASMQKLQALGKYVGIGLAAAFLGFSRKAINLGSELSDIAISTGFATEQFQVFRGALIDAGGKAESMEKAVTIMQKAIVQGSEGLTTYIRAFERLGLNVDNLRAMKPEEQFKAIGKAIASAKDQQGALTAAIEIFGQRNAPRLIEVFKRLDKDGYGKMAKDIEAAYGIMDAETQKALDKAADTIERFKNKATIRVGELIAGEGDFAAVKILGFKLMEAAANLGDAMITGFGQSIQFLRAGFRASAEWLTSKLSSSFKMITAQFQVGIIEALNAVIEKMNKIPGIEIETKSTKDAFKNLNDGIKESEKTWMHFFDEFVARQEAFDFKSGSGTYWADMANAQREILENSKAVAEEISGLSAPGGTIGGAVTSGTTGGDVTGGTTSVGRKKGEPMKAQWGTIGTKRGSNSRFGSRFGAMPTMDERERAAGLRLAGNDPMSGRRPSGSLPQDLANKPDVTELQEQTKLLTSIEEEIKRNP